MMVTIVCYSVNDHHHCYHFQYPMMNVMVEEIYLISMNQIPLLFDIIPFYLCHYRIQEAMLDYDFLEFYSFQFH